MKKEINRKELNNKLIDMGINPIADSKFLEQADLERLENGIKKIEEYKQYLNSFQKGEKVIVKTKTEYAQYHTAIFMGYDKTNFYFMDYTDESKVGLTAISSVEEIMPYKGNEHLVDVDWWQILVDLGDESKSCKILVKDKPYYEWELKYIKLNQYSAGAFLPFKSYKMARPYDKRYFGSTANDEYELSLNEVELLKLQEKKYMRNEGKYDNMNNRDMKCGIEIELSGKDFEFNPNSKVDKEDIIMDKVESMFKIFGLDDWKVVHDGSIEPYGCEIVSPVLNRERFSELRTVLNIAKMLKLKPNKSCGLHVHHDISDFNMRNVYNLGMIYMRYEYDLLPSIFNYGRMTNNYCRPALSIKHKLDTLSNKYEGDKMFSDIVDNQLTITSRYCALNLCAFERHGTVEFRGYQGSRNYNDIIAWVELTKGMVEKAKSMEGYEELFLEPTSTRFLLEDYINIPRSAQRHIKSMINKKINGRKFE